MTTKIKLLAFILCILVFGCKSPTDIAWEDACKANTVTSYKLFLQEYPDSSYAAKASARVCTLEELEIKKKERLEKEKKLLEEEKATLKKSHETLEAVLQSKDLSSHLIPEKTMGKEWVNHINLSDSIKSLKDSVRTIAVLMDGGLVTLIGDSHGLVIPMTTPFGNILMVTDAYNTYGCSSSQLADFPLPMADGCIYKIQGRGKLFGIHFQTDPVMIFAVKRDLGLVHISGSGIVTLDDGTTIIEPR